MSSKIFLFCLACWGSMLAQPVLAQRERRDTAGTGSVDIVSAFKPLLRDPVKIQFAPQPPQADTTRPKLIYRIPSQELSITYQPGTLKPLAYQADSNRGFAAAQYLKLGYGNLRNPYASLAIELGKQNPIHIYADHRAASGKLAFQDYSLSSIRVHGQLPSGSKGAWTTVLSAARLAANKYGLDASRPSLPLDSIRQSFHRIGIEFGYRPIQPTQSGFQLDPVVGFDYVGDRFSNKDLSAHIKLPIRYAFNDQFSLQVLGAATWGQIRYADRSTRTNLVYSLNPSLRLDRPHWSIQAGIRPSGDSTGVRMYPDFMFQWNRSGKPYWVRLQWTGELQRTGYRDLYTVNPWIQMPGQWRNRGEIDRSVRFQYQRRSHWVYELQVGYATIQNQYLFINDTSQASDGRSFQTVYADRLQNLYARGKFSYQQADRWSIRGDLTWNNYHGLDGQAEPWGLLPVTWNLHGTYRWPKRLTLQADVYSWFAPYYLTKSGLARRTEGALDMNLGAEMPVTKSIRGWLQLNNLLNRSYSRWSQYPVYGFHFVGGIVISLDKSIP